MRAGSSCLHLQAARRLALHSVCFSRKRPSSTCVLGFSGNISALLHAPDNCSSPAPAPFTHSSSCPVPLASCSPGLITQSGSSVLQHGTHSLPPFPFPSSPTSGAGGIWATIPLMEQPTPSRPEGLSLLLASSSAHTVLPPDLSHQRA